MVRMTWESSSMPSTSLWARWPSAAHATPKNSENTTICKISLVAIASTMERGTRWAPKSFADSEATGQRQGEVVAGAQDIDQHEAHQQRHQRLSDEPQHRLGADA